MNLTRYSVVPRKIPLRALQWWVLVLAIYLAGYRWVLNSEMLELPSDLPAFSSTVPLGRAMGNLGIGFVLVTDSAAAAAVMEDLIALGESPVVMGAVARAAGDGR